ncbi:MAG TPA: hypothetical protein VF904_03025 [Anaeromyxobacteraceae bacterium]
MKLTVLGTLGTLAFAAAARAGDEKSPRNVQDPPGRVSVDQPAGVAFDDRDTERDTTDPMHGSTYGDLRKARVMEVVTTEQSPAAVRRTAEASGPAATAPAPTQVSRQPSSAQPQPGRDVRASQDEPTRTLTGTPDTSLGTDIGYGTGTEPETRQR